MLTIFHTNDFHNKLAPNQAAFIRSEREKAGACTLLLDAGDAVSAGNITYHPDGEPILTLMSETGYDAMTVGNRDFHLTRVGFHSKLSNARFPILSGNIVSTNVNPNKSSRDRSTTNQGTTQQTEVVKGTFGTAVDRNDTRSGTHDPPVTAHIVREVPGFGRVVIFGVTVPMITRRMLVRKVSAYVFDDPVAVGIRLAAELRAAYAPDLLIALTHIGIAQDRLLAERTQEIDLLIGGHSHVLLEKGEHVERTLIVQAGSHGKYLGVVTVARAAGAHVSISSSSSEVADGSQRIALQMSATILPLPAPVTR